MDPSAVPSFNLATLENLDAISSDPVSSTQATAADSKAEPEQRVVGKD
jgi:hypothetical protein